MTDRIIPPAFVDDGAPGTWLDAIRHSPLLNVSDHSPHNNTKPLCPEPGCSLPIGSLCTMALCPSKRRVLRSSNHDSGVA